MLVDLAAAIALATPLFLMGLALLVFIVRPGGRVNQLAGAFLFLRGASDLMWHFMWYGGIEPPGALTHVGHWFDLPTHFLVLLLLHELYPARRPGVWRGVALGTAFAVTVAFLVAFAWDRTLLVERITSGARGNFQRGSLHPVLSLFGLAVQVTAVAVSARVAASPHRSVVERRQAGVVGLAFLVLLLHATILDVGLFPRMALGTVNPLPRRFLDGSIGLVILGLCVFSVSRLAGSFEPRAERLALGFIVFVAAASTAVVLKLIAEQLWALQIPYWAAMLRHALAMTSAALLAVAFVRFGLAGFGATTRRRITLLAHGSLLCLLLVVPGLVAVSIFEGGYTGVTATILLVVAATTLAPAPLRTLAAAGARLLTLDPAEDAAVGERARRYRDALERRLATSGHIPPPEDPALAALRAELDLGDDDHANLQVLVEARRLHPGTPVLLGRYRVEAELGRGAFGAALLAVDEATGRRVVLKRYHGSEVEDRALEEARALNRVSHPRIVPLLTVERAHDEVFLVLGHASGGSVHDLLRREKNLPADRALDLTRDLLDALGALHATGLVHRDVKPANLLLDAEGRLLLADLGASRILEEQAAGEATLTTSPVIGSYATVAPEVLRGGKAGPAADVYAAGAVLYKLLTGEDYVDLAGRTPVEVMNAVLHATPRLPHPRVPAHVEPILRWALEKDPTARYADAGEMKGALEAGVAEVARRAPPKTP